MKEGTDLLNDALAPFNQYDACAECGKRTDGLMICTYSHDESTIKLCPDCMTDSGFCLGCGFFSSGMKSFDFSSIEGYCSGCVDEINDCMNEGDK